MENFSVLIDSQMKPPVAKKEGKPRTPGIGTFAPLMPAGDLAPSNERMDSRRIYAQSIANDGRIYLNFTIHKLDHCHHQFKSLPIRVQPIGCA